MDKMKKWLLSLCMVITLVSMNFMNLHALEIKKVDANSSIGKEFAFQPCVSEETTIKVDTNFEHFNDYYTYTSSFPQPIAGDEYGYRIELKKDQAGNYLYVDQEKRIMPAIRYLYENVGMYDGEKVDARVTLSDIVDPYQLLIDPDHKIYATDPLFDHRIYLDHAGIGFCAGRCHVKIEFLKQDGSLLDSLKGNMTGTDLDSGQGVYNVTGVECIYYKNNTIISSANNGVQANSNQASGMYDENGQFLMLLSGPVVTFDWCKQASTTSSRWSEGRYISFQKAGFLKNDTPSPMKGVDQEKVSVNSYDHQTLLHYEIMQYVPYQPLGFTYSANNQKVKGGDYHYTLMKWVDTLPQNATPMLEDVIVLNEFDEDVTHYFKVDQENEKVIIQANSAIMNEEEFYNHTYRIDLPVRIDEKQLAEYTHKGTFVENEVQLIYSQYQVGDDIDGGKAKAISEFVYEIDSFHDEGSSITSSKKNIIGGASEQFDYEAKEGFYITGLKVDGKEIEFSKQKGSYTFGNINSYHTIEVISQPYYKIDTAVINGTISDSSNYIEKGESQIIMYQPDESCYLDSIEVDGNRQNIQDYEKEYPFHQIQANHEIKVVYEPYQWIETTAINGIISGENAKFSEQGNSASYRNLKAGKDIHVTYQPFKGYYLDHIELETYQYDTTSKKYEKINSQSFSTKEELVSIENSFDFINLQYSYRIKVVYEENPVIQITKTINGDYHLANGIPTAIFKISGVDYLGRNHTFYRTISFKEDVENNKLTTRSKTMEDHSIPAGNYEIEEINTSRYSLVDIIPVLNATVDHNKALIDTRQNHEVHVEMVNQQTNFKDYSHNDLAINQIKGNPQFE